MLYEADANNEKQSLIFAADKNIKASAAALAATGNVAAVTKE